VTIINLSQEIKDSEIENIGVVFSIDAEDKFMNLDLIWGKTDSSLVPKFEKQMGNLKWNSRIIMSEKYGSKEYYVLSFAHCCSLNPGCHDHDHE
jgi:hypothetical protein